MTHKEITHGHILDTVGQITKVGDRIVYASNVGNKVNMKVGTVKAFRVLTEPFKEFRTEYDASPSDPKIKVIVQFDDEEKTNIFPAWTKRFVRIYP